jgi:hypothetical protein
MSIAEGFARLAGMMDVSPNIGQKIWQSLIRIIHCVTANGPERSTLHHVAFASSHKLLVVQLHYPTVILKMRRLVDVPGP